MVYCQDKKVAKFTIIFLVFSSQLPDAAQKPQRQASQDMPTRAPECLVLHLLSLALRPEWRHFLSVGGKLGSTSTSGSTSVRILRLFPIHGRTDMTDTTSTYSKPWESSQCEGIRVVREYSQHPSHPERFASPGRHTRDPNVMAGLIEQH
jgi:hypothetical protein